MLKEDVRNLPEKPGVYIMHDADDEVIYVGKAKVLKNRVSQYFQKNKNHSPKVIAMVSHIAYFEYIITDTEFEALVLECNLIKRYSPRYNILLKDDKNYPYLKITINEDYPKILLARKIEKDGARYFGPYLSTTIVRETIDTIRKVFNVRSCNRVLPRDIGKGRPCLNYHIKNCSAPCNNHISQEEYKSIFNEIISFLEGKHDDVIERLTAQMSDASDNLQFEKAARLRDKLSAIKAITEKQKIVSTSSNNQDIIAMAEIENRVCIQLFFVRGGKVVGREHFISKSEDDKKVILNDFVKEYYLMSTYIPNTIIIQHNIEDKELIEQWLSERSSAKINIIVPKKGEKFKVVKMVENNALETLKLHIMSKDINKKKINDLLLKVKETLSLEKVPMRIESYDISNISGTDSVGVCVVFDNGIPQKSDYRKFNIKTVEDANDYASMREILYRRISNAIDGDEKFLPLPNLILLDGGKGHVSTVLEVLDFFKVNIPLFGLVKDDKHRTSGVVSTDAEIGIKRDSAEFKFFTRIQDEVHRYALGAHKAKRKKTTFASELDDIVGVGEKKKAILLKAFKNINVIKTASVEQLSGIKGIDSKTAASIYDYFHNNDKEQ